MAENLEEIYKMSVFDYKDLDKIDILNDIQLYDQIFETVSVKSVPVVSESQEKLDRSTKAVKSSTKEKQASKGLNTSNPQSPAELFVSKIDDFIRQDKDSYFSKLLAIEHPK